MPILEGTAAIIAAIVVVVLVVIFWKLLKFAFRVGLIVAAAALLYFGLKWAGFL